MIVYAVVCVNSDLVEDVIVIYERREKAEEHVRDFQGMYNDLGCYLKVGDFVLR